MELRDYQTKMNKDIVTSWGNGAKSVLSVLDTGLGKTVCFTEFLQNHHGVSVAIAHRQELVGQMSLTLAKRGVVHNIIAPSNIIRGVCKMHMEEVGKCWFNPSARCHVAGVGTLVRRADSLRNICQQVTLWVIDEAHHVLRDNQWGKAIKLFPHAKGLGVTATPLRADGHGLGSSSDGVFDTMVEGPAMRDMIDQGYLTDYRIFSPSTSDLMLDDVDITASGDFHKKKLKAAVQQSHIVGDIVQHYLKIAPGKLGITFVTDVETADKVAKQYCEAGVPAVSLNAKTPAKERVDAIKRFRNRELLQLVNVDLFTEGFDLCAIEVVSMGRPTASYGWFAQAFGRGLRPMEGKSHAIIIDHVGNVLRHGLPDAQHLWTLDRRERRSKTKATVLISVCSQCTGVYDRVKTVCPYCGYKEVVQDRSSVPHVDGDLLELDIATLARLRGGISKADRPVAEVKKAMLYSGATEMVANCVAKNHRLAQEAQVELRSIIRAWGDLRRMRNVPDSESYREFYITYGVDVLTAQGLGRKDTVNLIERMS